MGNIKLANVTISSSVITNFIFFLLNELLKRTAIIDEYTIKIKIPVLLPVKNNATVDTTNKIVE